MALPKNKIIKIVVDAAKKYEEILNNRVFICKESWRIVISTFLCWS